MQRINWIDWAKTLAAMTVVFCHLPQSQEWFYFRYLQAFIISVFFFISGYLKKDRGSNHENWNKYWHGLVLPYIIYNTIVYPYWFTKYYMQQGSLPDFFTALKPIWGAILLQHNNSFCEPLDGPLWYLPAILIMHVTIDLCRKTQYQHTIMIMLCFISIILYGADKWYNFAPNLTPMGIMKNFPFYYMGYVLRQKELFKTIKSKQDFILCLGLLMLSIPLFHWHLTTYYAGQHILHIVIYYPACTAFLFGVLYGCKVLDRYHSKIITRISIGTLVIIGLHIVPITTINFIIEKYRGLSSTICYQWYDALIITISISAILYPIILLGLKYMPVLIGRKDNCSLLILYFIKKIPR